MSFVNLITNCTDHELLPSEDLLSWLDNSYIFYYSCSNCTKCTKCENYSESQLS